MKGGWATAAVVLALAIVGCGDDEENASDEPKQSGLEADADALVACLGEADVEAELNENVAFGVEADHVGVEASDLPSDLLKFDTGDGTLSGVKLWIFESEAEAEEARTAITLSDADDEKSWVDGRVVVSWYYPVNREAGQSIAVDECVAELNG